MFVTKRGTCVTVRASLELAGGLGDFCDELRLLGKPEPTPNNKLRSRFADAARAGAGLVQVKPRDGTN